MIEHPTRTRWFIVALIFCMGVLMFIDRVNISIAAKYIMPEYGLTDIQMGWIFSAFVLGYALLQIPVRMVGRSLWSSYRNYSITPGKQTVIHL